MALRLQSGCHPPRAVKWRVQILAVDERHQFEFLGTDFYLLVFIRTNQFNADPKYSGGRGATISPASNNTLRLNRLAQQLLVHCYKKGFRYWKAGVLLEGLVPLDCIQGDLFQAADSPRQKALMRAWDRVNQRFGRDTMQLAGQGLKPRWQMRREMLSPRFTTCWEELPRVKA